LASLPPWWRLLQCLRRYRDSDELVHLFNAAKYTSSIMVAIITGLRRMHRKLHIYHIILYIYLSFFLKNDIASSFITALWIILCLINSTYTSFWDIKMDWGLMKVDSKYALLRNELVFHKWVYYVAVPINIILRFSWTLNIIPLPVNSLLLGFLIALLEAYRRIQWNFFRLENEHLNNCGQYRAIKEIPLPF
ncbi:EXS family-domain-containing protein, partial [Cokeromyces recurvatus]|uniref:EXS family-domain-containing protein n=1 Tax=Cokeromyces recurvatus TaxID=90255 RepID=UPI00221FFE24